MLEPFEMEEKCFELFSRLGWDVSYPNPGCADPGYDLALNHNDELYGAVLAIKFDDLKKRAKLVELILDRVVSDWKGELEVKLYIPYFQYRTTPLPVEGGKFCQNMNRLLAGRINNLPFALMFAALKPTARKGNDYYNDFHTFIRVEKWDYGILQNPQFYEVGADYASTFRNGAAHSSIMSAEAAKECRRKTRTLINDFIMACPSKK